MLKACKCYIQFRAMEQGRQELGTGTGTERDRPGWLHTRNGHVALASEVPGPQGPGQKRTGLSSQTNGAERVAPVSPCLAGRGRCRLGASRGSHAANEALPGERWITTFCVSQASVRSGHSRTGQRLVPLTSGAVVQGTSVVQGPGQAQECAVEQDAVRQVKDKSKRVRGVVRGCPVNRHAEPSPPELGPVLALGPVQGICSQGQPSCRSVTTPTA